LSLATLATTETVERFWGSLELPTLRAEWRTPDRAGIRPKLAGRASRSATS
jgi:hypothetical protein